MDEFELINSYFKARASKRPEVVYGIGDDCACLHIPSEQDLLVSMDTLVADVHFLSTWDPYDIAYKAVMVNISDCAAMAAAPFAMMLALTIPQPDEYWLARFSEGLFDALELHHVALIGGDTTRGPLSVTLTVHGLAPQGQAVRRNGAKPGDLIYVSGALGLAAFGVNHLSAPDVLQSVHQPLIKKALHHPTPRTDMILLLREYASSAIDISDGLLADLNHLCQNSGLAAFIDMPSIPIHPILQHVQSSRQQALKFALTGGDDYELCFTIPSQQEESFLNAMKSSHMRCYQIGQMREGRGLYTLNNRRQYVQLGACGYQHFGQEND